ncbi:MAG: hypothetical protein HC824_19050 [Synechococcales cyanobacterium RM1_1_8]|nr:hypothetical protein [Synechococcales cyanobacterium RM1_1_8]
MPDNAPDSSPNNSKPDSSDSAAADAPSFGWNAYAERFNGRFAMIGFAALLITELITRQDFWTWIGL